MGLFDFMKDAGDTKGADVAKGEMDDLRTENLIIRKIKGLGLPVDDLRVQFDDGTARLDGTAPDQRSRQIMVVVAGNTPGVARVVENLDVPGAKPHPSETGGDDFYTVEKGDTLSAIAEDRLGDASAWRKIFEANRPMIDDPDEIYPGQVLRMPARA